MRLKDKDLQLKNAELKIKELKRQIQVLNSSQHKNAQEEKGKEDQHSEEGRKVRIQGRRQQLQQQ